MSTIVMFTDFSAQGSGYRNIAIGVGTELARRGHDVKLLGAGDHGQEHPFPFSVIPIPGVNATNEVWGLLKNMKEIKYQHVLALIDIPKVIMLMDRCGDLNEKFSGLFPLEAPPLIPSIAVKMMSLSGRFLMTKFGQEEFAKRHVSSDFVPIPVDSHVWYPVESERKETIRKALGIKGFTFLTVAENQERKNLSATAEIISHVPEARWILVTRTQTPVGWNIPDLLNLFGIVDRTLVVEKGMHQDALVQLYHASDAMLITSKAEGLGMPVLESMSCGLPVIAPRHTAFEEHLSDGRGFLFLNKHAYLDPFGNQLRYFPDIEDGVRACNEAMNLTDQDRLSLVGKVSAYLNQRSWESVGDVICRTLEL